MKYTWNFDRNAEYWNNDEYDTVEECIKDARNNMISDEDYVVYIAEVVPFEPKIDADDILCRLEEDAYEECGEFAEDWNVYEANKDDELSNALTQVLIDWLKKHHLMPNFYTVENIREYSLITGRQEG